MSYGTVQKGDVVMVDVPYLDGTGTVRRPAVVVSDTSQMLDVIIAGITSRIREPLPPTHYVIGRAIPIGMPRACGSIRRFGAIGCLPFIVPVSIGPSGSFPRRRCSSSTSV